MSDALGELETLDVVNTESEAEIIAGLLRGEGIPSMVRRTSLSGGMTDGFPGAAGPREILVHARNLAAARELVERRSG